MSTSPDRHPSPKPQPVGYVTLFRGDIHAPSMALLDRVLDGLRRL